MESNKLHLILFIILSIHLVIVMKCSIPGFITFFNKLFNPGKMPLSKQSGLFCQMLGVFFFISIISNFVKLIR